MARVLVVEDDQFVRSALIRQLTELPAGGAAGEESHTVRSVGTALEALREVAHFRFDVVILDLGLPDLDGSEALKMLRGITDVPVIIATARDDEAEIIRLLNDGADDYLTKPFSVEHLSARITAVLRRTRAGAQEVPPDRVLRVGGLSIDPLRRAAELDGVRLDLTRREFDLLAFLARRPGVVVPRKELHVQVWQQAYGDDQTIDVHLSWLRRKLGETAANPRYLHTLRGVGVKLQPPASPATTATPPIPDPDPAPDRPTSDSSADHPAPGTPPQPHTPQPPTPGPPPPSSAARPPAASPSAAPPSIVDQSAVPETPPRPEPPR